MRSLLTILLLSLAIMITALQAAGEVPSSDGDSGESSGRSATPVEEANLSDPLPGLVYGYGVELERPYVFTESEDGKTLYLNGLIYDGPGEEPPPKITVTETVRSEHELSVRAFEQSNQGVTYADRLELMADVYRSSPLVKNVRKFAQGLYVTWTSYPDEEEEIILTREDSAFDLAAFRETLVAEFWQTVSRGGMIAFGKNYHVSVPPRHLPKTVEQMRLIQSGAPRDSLDVMNTALQNKRFLEDLYQQSEGRREEE
jgi:hypothetical protein